MSGCSLPVRCTPTSSVCLLSTCCTFLLPCTVSYPLMDLEQWLWPVLWVLLLPGQPCSFSAAPPHCSVQSPVASEGAVAVFSWEMPLVEQSRGGRAAISLFWQPAERTLLKNASLKWDSFHILHSIWNSKHTELLSHTWMPAKIGNSCMGVSEFKVRTLNTVFLPFMCRDFEHFCWFGRNLCDKTEQRWSRLCWVCFTLD